MGEAAEYDAAVTATDRAAGRNLRLATLTGMVAGAAFLLLAWLTTQIALIRAALPFTDDPYDLVVSFALIGLVIVGGATAIRAIGHGRGGYDAAIARRIGIGAALASVIVAVAVTTDAIALLIEGLPLPGPGSIVTLTLLPITAVATIAALACAWRARSALLHGPVQGEPEPDLIDDVGSIAGWIGAGALAGRVVAWVERSQLSPRRHRVVVGVVGALGAGVAAIVWHAWREGTWASPFAAAVFGGLMALGVVGAYAVCLVPLRLIRTPSSD